VHKEKMQELYGNCQKKESAQREGKKGEKKTNSEKEGEVPPLYLSVLRVYA